MKENRENGKNGKTILEMEVSEIACVFGLDPEDERACSAISSFLDRFPEEPAITDFLPGLLERHLMNNGVAKSEDNGSLD